MTQKYSFTGLKVIKIIIANHEQNQSADTNLTKIPLDKNGRELPKQTSRSVDKKKITETGRINRKLEETILPQDQKEKYPHKQPSRI